MTHLDDNIALITGGGRGMGRIRLVKSVRERGTGEQAGMSGAVVKLEQRVLCRISEAGCVRPGR
jgi:hypothetical protein